MNSSFCRPFYAGLRPAFIHFAASNRFNKYSGSASDNPTTKFESSTIHQPAIFRSRASRSDHTRKITDATIKSAAKKLEIRVPKTSSKNRLKFGP